MTRKGKESGGKLFKMLWPQYKPVEEAMFKMLKDKPELIELYKSASDMKKIKMLDFTASKLGL